MEREMLECVVVLPIEPIERGVEYRGALPLHCTVMPWFRQDEGSYTALANFLMLSASWADGLKLVSERVGFFGPDEDVRVHLLERNEQLDCLHTGLLIFLAQKNNLPKHRDWIGAGYRPHVSDSGERSFPPGSSCTPENLVLVQRRNGAKKLRASYELGGIPF